MMRIVTETPRRLEIEHKSYVGSALCMIVYGAFGWLITIEQPLTTPDQFLFGVALMLSPILYLLMVTQTSRVALDRDRGTVRFFRKTLVSQRILEMPLNEFFGARAEINLGRKTTYRLYLIFVSDRETWQIPVSSFDSWLGRARIKQAINDWFGVSSDEVEKRYPDRPPLRWF